MTLETIIIIGTSIVTAASAIANITPTETDNRIIGWISKVIHALALNFRKD